MKYSVWRERHYANPEGLRLGQRFYNEFLRGSVVADGPNTLVPNLFNAEDGKAEELIINYLVATQHYPDVPSVK
jgi:hypothetical protein